MNKTNLSSGTSSPTGDQSQPSASDSQTTLALRSEFFAAATQMTWQLAIVVLVPILGGVALDKQFKTAPVITIIGFVLALAGMSMVVWRQMKLFSPSRPIIKEHKV